MSIAVFKSVDPATARPPSNVATFSIVTEDAAIFNRLKRNVPEIAWKKLRDHGVYDSQQRFVPAPYVGTCTLSGDEANVKQEVAALFGRIYRFVPARMQVKAEVGDLRIYPERPQL